MKNALVLFALIISLSPLFFFKLGQSSLTSFDEAWYAAIAKNMLSSRDPLNLSFNGRLFADHPPAGFWFMAVSMAVFSVHEFGARAASAIIGLLSLALVFALGKKMSSVSVGFASALTLASSPWFILRARSGNLDVPLTFFFVLTFFLALLAAENKKYFFPLSLSITLLVLTKTLVPFTILPALLLIFIGSPNLKSKEFVFSLSLSLSLVFIWLISRLITIPHFFQKYLNIGLPQGQTKTPLWQNILQVKTYLHHGIGNIFRPAVASLPFGIFLFKNKPLLAALIFIGAFLTPFAFSSRGQIWHLLPIHPFLILTFFTVLYSLIAVKSRRWAKILTLALTLTVSVPQITKNWREFIAIPAFVSDEAILSKLASKYPYPLVIDENFIPAAVFYSGKTVVWNSSRDAKSFIFNNESTLVITHTWRLAEIPSDKYQLLASDRDKVLILLSK